MEKQVTFKYLPKNKNLIITSGLHERPSKRFVWQEKLLASNEDKHIKPHWKHWLMASLLAFSSNHVFADNIEAYYSANNVCRVNTISDGTIQVGGWDISMTNNDGVSIGNFPTNASLCANSTDSVCGLINTGNLNTGDVVYAKNESPGASDYFKCPVTLGSNLQAEEHTIPPTITSSTYDASSGELVVIGVGFIVNAGDDVDVTKLTLTGEGNVSYTLTADSSAEAEIDDATQFTVTVAGTDVAAVEALFNVNGKQANDATVYNIAAADDFITAFVVGDTSDATNAITVEGWAVLSYTPPFDISTMTYTGASFDFSGQTTYGYDISWNNDGSKFFLVDVTGKLILEYYLTTPYDLSTVSYANKSLIVDVNESSPGALAFNDDGSKLYVLGYANKTVYQYHLTTPFDLSTAIDSNNSLDVSSKNSYKYLAFNNNGGKLFIGGNSGIHSYTLATPYDIFSASDDNLVLDITNEVTNQYSGGSFNASGTLLLVTQDDEGTTKTFQYDLSIPFDLSSATYSNNVLNLAGEVWGVHDAEFDNNNGLYFVDRLGYKIKKYTTPSGSAINWSEVAANDGDLKNGPVPITLTGDTFVNTSSNLVEGTHYTLPNKPAGLTSNIAVAADGLTATLTLSGTAIAHEAADSVADLQITFLDDAFTTNTASRVVNGVSANTGASISFDNETTAPTLAQVTAVGTTTSNTAPDYTFSSDEAGTFVVGGSCGSSTTNTVVAGNNILTLTDTDNSSVLGFASYTDCTITVTDALGNESIALTISDFEVVNNSAPVISGTPTISVGEDASYSFTVSSSDADTGDSATYSMTGNPSWLSINASTGVVSGTPTQADIGTTSSIVITVADTAGATDSLAGFNVTVSNTNDAPVISGTPAATVAEGDSYSFTPTVTDDDTSDTTNFSISNKPNWATFSTSTGALAGTPSRTDAADYEGIVISVKDSANESASLTAFTITVTNTNEAPVANAQTQVLEEDSPLTITLMGTDADEDELTYAIVTEPAHGTLVQSTDNTWVYTPENNYNGTDSVTYKATDAEVDSEPATVGLTINPVNDAPIAQVDDIVLTYSESGRYVLSVLTNDSDVDGDELTIINASSSIGATSIEAGQLIYQMQGVIEGNIELQYVINDGHTSKDNGNGEARVTISFDSNVDTLLPVITLPNDIDIDASALFTKVDLGVATALGNKGESLPVSLVDGVTLFEPGSHLVYWQAQDSEGFSNIATQRLAIHPLINFAKDRQGSEGEPHKVAVHLNGQSPSYPVTVSYGVSGNSDNDDHDLVSGKLVINSGLVGYIEFETFDDALVEEDETVVITLDESVNLGAKSVFTLTITEDNIAPQASVTVSQNNEQRTLIDKNLGDVVITSDVFDANNEDTHSYVWKSINGELIDTDTDNTSFTFDPTSLVAGPQILYLIVTDSSDTPLSTEVFVYLDIVEALPTLTDSDSDGDLIPDDVEGYGDADDDGIADYLDSNSSSCNVQPEEVDEHHSYLVETESSTCLRRGVNTMSNQSGSLLLSVDEVIKDDEATNVGGVFDFIISSLPVAGQSVSLVLPQRLPIPDNAIYRKLVPDTGWADFVVDNNNYYSSAAGEIGYCPAPNDDSWTVGLTAGHWCVQITIEDGGLNDDDGVANSRIVDPGGVATWINGNTLPEIVSEQVSTTQSKAITIDVLGNDTDSDGDSLSIISTSVDFGNVSIVEQQLHYEPDANFFGLATINYGVSDGNNGTGYGDVLVNVIENTAPVTVDDDASTDDSTEITIDVLANDTDADDDELTLDSASAEQGSIAITNNKLVYTPLIGFDGVDTVTYEVDDNNGGASQGQVIIAINAYEIITITNKSSGGSFGSFILLIGSAMLFIRRKNRLVICKAASRKTLTKFISLLALLSLSVSLSSQAMQISGLDFFIKTELGQSKAKTSGLSQQVPVGVITQVDDKATSWSVGLGANITNEWSVTLSYVDMGEGGLTITGETLSAGDYHQSVSQVAPVLVQGVGLDGRYHFLQGKQYNASVLFGVLAWDSNVTSTYEDQRIEHDDDGIDVYYGIEGTYKIDEVWGVNVGIKRYALDVNDIDTAYLGLTYQF